MKVEKQERKEEVIEKKIMKKKEQGIGGGRVGRSVTVEEKGKEEKDKKDKKGSK